MASLEQTESTFRSDEFLKKLRARDHSAISELVHCYTRQLFRASMGMGFDKNAANELTQSVWATFFEAVSKFEGRAHVRTFLFRILYNKASEMRRDRNRFDSPDPVEEVLEKRFSAAGHWIKPPADPEGFLTGSELLGTIEKCMERLTDSQKMAFSLREIEEKDTPEICKILGVSVTNLGVLLYRARNRLRECVEGKGIRQGE